MAKYVRFEDNKDLAWLQNVVDRYVLRIKTNPSMHLGDDIEVILRIHDSLHSAADVTEAEQMGVPSKVIETDVQLEASKKTARKADKARTKTIVPNLCKKHPTYGGQRVTSRDCDECWKVYKSFNPLEYDRKRRDFLRKRKTATAK
jgi:hypothetical protein